jgi:hypothetical protein
MLCNLATDVKDPLERLKAIHASSVEAKALSGKIKDVTPRDFSIFGAPLLLQGAIGLYGRSGLADRLPPAGNVLISNVPGLPIELYMAGARMLHYFPVSIPYHGTALNITVQSYAGKMDWGITACRRALSQAEAGELIDNLRLALKEIEALAGSRRGDPGARSDDRGGAGAPRQGGGGAARSRPRRRWHARRAAATAARAVTRHAATRSKPGAASLFPTRRKLWRDAATCEASQLARHGLKSGRSRAPATVADGYPRRPTCRTARRRERPDDGASDKLDRLLPAEARRAAPRPVAPPPVRRQRPPGGGPPTWRVGARHEG